MLKLLSFAETARHRRGEKTTLLSGQEDDIFQSLLLGLLLSSSLYHSLRAPALPKGISAATYVKYVC